MSGKENNIAEDVMEDFDELDFEQESMELLEDKEIKEDFGGKNDTTRIFLDPKVAEKDQESASQGQPPEQKDIAVDVPHEPKEQESGEQESDESSFKESKIISQTLGEILVSQKKYTEALEVFKTLKEKQPDNQNVHRKITLLEQIIALENK